MLYTQLQVTRSSRILSGSFLTYHPHYFMKSFSLIVIVRPEKRLHFSLSTILYVIFMSVILET